MSDLQKKLQEAYNSVSMPPDLKKKTLEYIHEQTKQAEPVTPDQTEPAVAEDAPLVGDMQVVPGGAVIARKRKRSRTRTLALSLAACFILAILSFGGVRIYTFETAYVGIDVNPSFELGINTFDTVVSVQAYNDDAQKLLDALDLTGKSYDEAMQTLAKNKEFSGYLTEESFMDISIACDNARQYQALQETSESYLAVLPCEGVCHGVSAELRAEAHHQQMGVGRYEIALELVELDPTLTMEDCQSMSMREMRNRIAALLGEDASSSSSYGWHHGEGQGQGQGQGQGAGRHR